MINCPLGGVQVNEFHRLVPQISYRQIGHWSTTGILAGHFHRQNRPEVIWDGGSGYSRCWEMSEVRRAQRIVRLMGIGVDLETARSIASDVVAARKAAAVVGDIVKALEETK